MKQLTDQKLEVKATRVLPIFLSVLTIACAAALVAAPVLTGVKGVAWTYWPCALLLVLVAVPFVMLAVRTRPLYEVDSRGITDNGVFTGGFGLIEWHHIKYVQTFTHKGSTSLVVKVDNLDDLLARRNALARPLLWMNCKLSAIMGGELMLPITISNVGLANLLERISEYSRQSSICRDVVVAPRTLFENLRAQLLIAAVVLPIVLLITILSSGLYLQWIPHGH